MIILRLWHKALICCLPKQQLLAQWRECCAIAKTLAVNGTPNHILVNKVLDYPISMFGAYTNLVLEEIKNRGYIVKDASLSTFYTNISSAHLSIDINKNKIEETKSIFDYTIEEIFPEWHDNRYLRQCLYNLEEKAMCKGISMEEWGKIVNIFGEKYDLFR